MPLDRLIADHATLVRAATSDAEILAHTLSAARELGFDRIAIVHALWFVRPGARLIFLHNFDEWGEIFLARRYHAHDPVLLTARRASKPFTWTEMVTMNPPDRLGMRILDEAGRHGLRVGFTVPVAVPGEPSGCCSFATDADELPPVAYRRAAAWIAGEAFEQARRLHGYPVSVEDSEVPHLSPRRLECLCWATIGRTDAQIALIMGLRPSTIRTYMRDLRYLFGVCSRTELARAAQRAGLIGLDDVFP